MKHRYFVSWYEAFPIFEPAEGGYYYEGRELVDSIRVGSLKKARKIMKAEAEEMGCDFIGKNYSRVSGRYIGDAQYIYVETVQGIHKSGRHPYC